MKKTQTIKLILAAFAAAAIGLTPKAWATGELPGIFSVSATKKVQFSQGNLQAVFASAGNSCAWQFADNQYDYVGYAAANNAINGNGSVSAAGKVDLFGWSTASTYYGINNSGDAVDYSGDFVDWGNLAISNGGNTENSGWRTLTRDEWAYLFSNHTFGFATVAGVKGVIIAPDNYAGPAIDSNHRNGQDSFANNTIDVSTWQSTYVPACVVFLPAAGFRLPWIGQVQENGYYWSSSAVGGDSNNRFAILLGLVNAEFQINVAGGGNWPANDGFSVRLVKNIYTISYDANGGSGAPSEQMKYHGIDLTLSSTVPMCAGMTFAGWNTAADGSGTSYASDATFGGNADTTLYAQWEEVATWTMDYTGDIQTFTAPCSGIYQLRVWGAQGGQFVKAGGLGGYATCRTTLTQGETIYIYVGGKGGDGYVSSTGGAGGWNGGGAGGSGVGGYNGSAGGGGATHISKVNNQVIGGGSGQCASLVGTDYIIVAGGGGGASHPWTAPGSGGGTEGGLGTRCNGTDSYQEHYSANFYYSTDRSYGANGGNGFAESWACEGSGGGGGGYYGGTANYPNVTFDSVLQDAGGCGGNSACNSAFATVFSTTAGQREGDGMAEINLLIRGKGTADDPCLIGSAQELKNFAAIVNSGSANLHGKLTAPIDLEGSQANQWTPIGTSSYPYNGTFDGQGFTISNLYYHQSVGCAGLFSRAGGSARIKNVRVVVDIDNTGNGATAAGGGTEAGGILGMGSEGTVIINCSVAGSVLSFSNVGGIAGSGAVTIVNCYNEATVKFYSAVGQTGGGIHGYGGSPTLINCYNVGKIINTGSATSHMGNIAAAATATDCYSLANCCQNGAGAGWSNGAANQISGTTMTSEAMHSASFVSTLNGNAAAQRSTYSDIEDWILHPDTSLPVHKNSIKYSIDYNLNGGNAYNAAYYDVTTATFTLNNPTRDGYLFAGWTGSNGDTPQTVVTVAQGSTGNMAYTANWISWDEVNAHVGKVIGADGKMYKTVAAAQNAGTTASGVIAYWGWAGSAEASGSAYRGLAISLETWTAIPWCTDPVSWYAGSTLTQALDSNDGCERTTTFGRLESRNVTDVYGHIHNHQAAALVYDYSKSRPSGSSRWFVPSLGQWNLVAKALTGGSSDISEIDNPDYTYSNLSAKLTAAGASGLGWAAYWSSTEKDGTTMWIFDIGGIGGDRNGGRASTRSKQQCGEAEYLRAFFAFEDATDAVYTISYDANGGSGEPAAQAKDGGIDLTLSSTVPTREGCTFVGWNTSANGSGASYDASATFTLNADTTLYAQWEIVLDDETATVETAADCGQGESVAAIPVSVSIGEGVSSKTGVTVRYELDRVTTSGEVVSEGATTESADDLSIDLTSVVSNAFFKVAAVVESTDGTGAKTKVSSETTIGVLAVTTAPKTAIIGVPWKSLAGGDISVDKLVRTENLTKGDQIMVYDSSTGDYKAWALNEGKTWDEVATVTANESPMNPGAASATSVARGSGVWLTRQDPSQPIYLVGQFVDETVETDLVKPDKPGEQAWNLVASPKVEPVDVATLLDGRQATDKVMVPSVGAPKNFIYNATLSKWGYIDYTTGEDGRVRAFFRDDDTLIQPGTGFWYLNGDATHDSLAW